MHQVETVRQGMVNPRNNFTFSQLPIWRQILLLLGGSILLVGYAVGIVFEQLETDYLRQNLEEQNHRILSVLSATSIDAVISEDQARLETIITQLATLDPNILSLTMENERRETLAHWQRISDTGAMTHLAFAEDILFDGEHFGRIFIDWNIQPLQQQIDLHVLSMRLFSTAVLIALTGLILFWIYLLISKPINTLNKRLHMIAQGDLTSEVHISSGKELIRLADSVNTLSRILRINESRKKEIRQLAFFDKTTGLASRAHFLQRFSDTLKAATRRDEQLALIFLDLDGFKDINDSMGHETGDQLLAIIGQRLEKPLRDVDFAARFGGDEFCIIVDNITDEFDAAEVANRCLKEIHQPVELGTQTRSEER
ncbi:GGDEF domain-containing protein, partial [endosymbiont of Ridgeia piscesae]